MDYMLLHGTGAHKIYAISVRDDKSPWDIKSGGVIHYVMLKSWNA